MEISCAFATSLQSHEHARIAESLGYRRAYFYDSPAIYPDVWVQLCRAAEITERIVLGPGVLIPSLRHPMTTAAAVGTLAAIAGSERVVVGVGSGFTGRMALGQRAMRWADVTEYVRAVRGLLRGEEVTWEGATVRMLHSDGFAPERPLEVPFVIAAAGPKGLAAARELGDGVFGGVPLRGFEWSTCLTLGTVLSENESPQSERVVQAAGHAAAMMLHYGHENGVLPPALSQAWMAAYADIPQERRHLAMHEGHLVFVNERDREFVGADLIATYGLANTPDGWRERLRTMAEGGVTEIAYQPAGPDIPRELEAFATVATEPIT